MVKDDSLRSQGTLRSQEVKSESAGSILQEVASVGGTPWGDSERDLLGGVVEEFIARYRRGENPSAEEYAERWPDLAEEVRELISGVVALEQLKVCRERLGNGQASLRGAHLERLGDLRIVRELGRGGMGIVYEAEQQSLDRRVAVKVLPKQSLLDGKHLARFHREAKTAARLHHSNIVPVLGVGQHEGYHYYVMQLIDGMGLEQCLRTEVGSGKPNAMRCGEADITTATFPPGLPRDKEPATGCIAESASVPCCADARFVARVGIQAAGALQYAHEHGVLHRDIKPANLIVDNEGVVWVTDFGLAKAIEQDDITHSGEVMGTLRYLAPEHFADVEVDARSDIYSLGVTLYELATRQPAFGDISDARLMERIVAGEIAPPRSLNGEIPRDFETILLRAIAREPGERFQSAADLAQDLHRFLADKPPLARRASTLEHLGRWSRRNRLTAALIATAAFLLILVAASAMTGYARTNAALKSKKAEQARAEVGTQVGLQVLDRIFARFASRHFDPLQSLFAPGDREYDRLLRPALSPEVAAILEELLPFYDRLAKQSSQDPRVLRGAALAQRRIGDIIQGSGDYEKAGAAYVRAIGLYEQLDRADQDVMLAVEIAGAYNELGHTYQMLARLEEQRASHLLAAETLESALAKSAFIEIRVQLARTYYWLADTRPTVPPTMGSGRLSGPVNRSSRSVPPRNAIPGRPLSQGNGLADSRRSSPGLGPRGGPLGWRDNPRWNRDALRQSEIYLDKAIEQLEAIPEGPSREPDRIAFRAFLYHVLGSVQRRSRQTEEAVKNYRMSVAIQEDLTRKFPESVSFQIVLGWFEQPLGASLARQGEWQEARRFLEHSRDTLSKQLEADPEMTFLHGLIGHACNHLAAVYSELGEDDLADQVSRDHEMHTREMYRNANLGSTPGPHARPNGRRRAIGMGRLSRREP